MSTYYMISGNLVSSAELYHHGIKGMKWGVRRYQNPDGSLTTAGKKRVKTYREKEIGKIEKRRVKERKREERALDRDQKHYEKVLDKYGAGDKANKALTRYRSTKGAALYSERMAKAEISKLRNYKLSDINAEKKEVGAAVAASTVANIGAIGLKMLGAPVVMYSVPRIDAIKTGRRVDKDTANRISKQTADEVNKITLSRKSSGFSNNTRVTGQEESDFWKAFAEEELKRQRG